MSLRSECKIVPADCGRSHGSAGHSFRTWASETRKCFHSYFKIPFINRCIRFDFFKVCCRHSLINLHDTSLHLHFIDVVIQIYPSEMTCPRLMKESMSETGLKVEKFLAPSLIT